MSGSPFARQAAGVTVLASDGPARAAGLRLRLEASVGTETFRQAFTDRLAAAAGPGSTLLISFES